MSGYAKAVINWEHPEKPNTSRWCRTSSMIWARLLLAPSRVVFADGKTQEFAACILEKAELSEIDIPSGPDLKKTGDLQKCVVFTVKSSTPDMRIRVRAYHTHDGTEYGHPGAMRLESTNTHEWDQAYKQCLDAMNAIMRQMKGKANG